MAIMNQPLPPLKDVNEPSTPLLKTQKQLDHFAWLMDQCFRIPGTSWRFGLEAILGLFPGAGDVVSGMLSLTLLVRAFQFKLPKVVVARMILNTLIDVAIGAIPFLGDAFDFVWKSNTRNMKLFHQYAQEPDLSTKSHWIFIVALIGGFGLLFFLVCLFVIWLIYRFYQNSGPF
jgi:Domain of unknown function (DUF4112)